jgi:hypothetical protein
MTNKLTAGVGMAALCLLGVAGFAGSNYSYPAGAAVGATLVSDTAGAITTFTSGTSIISANGDYQLMMEANGDLVENSLHGISPIEIGYSTDGDYYLGGGNASAEDNWSVSGSYVGETVTQIWQSKTSGYAGARAVLQADGNFVIYSASNAVLWASHTAGHPGSTLAIQDDGNVVLYEGSQPLWATKTVSIVDGHGNATVNFRSCPEVDGWDCEILSSLRSGSGITMLCWEDVPSVGWSTPPPTDRWFYALVDGTTGDLGFINAGYVDGQIKTPACTSPPALGHALPPVPATLATESPQTSSSGSGSGGGAPATTYTETVGGPTHTWTNYSNAGGTEGPTIPTHTSVQVTCVVQGFKVADGNTNWYRIASSPWDNAYYASADAFYNNGATSGSLNGTPYVDPKVPSC